MKFTKTSYLLLPAFCIFALTGIAQTVPGKMVLSKGEKILINNDVQVVGSQEAMGQTIDITSTAKMAHEVLVKDKKPGSYILSTTLTQVKSSFEGMGMTKTFDSDKKEDVEGEQGKLFKDQLNVSEDAEYDQTGHVISTDKKDVAVAGTNPMLDMMKKMSGPSGPASAAFFVIPSDKKVGNTWSDSLVYEGSKTYTEYNFKALNGNTAIVTSTGKQSTNMKMEQQGMEMTVSMEATISSEGTVDISTGLIQQKTSTVNGTTKTEVMGQTIPGTTKVTTITTVTKI
ncbi:MAG: DUF6263 family protein [Ferruginibacter sp.]